MPRERAVELGIETEAHVGGWLPRLVGYYLERKSRAAPKSVAGATAKARAHHLIRGACVRSAVSGVAAAAVSTVSALVTASTDGAAALVGVPLSAAAIGGDLAYRTAVHVDLVWDLAATFDVPLDPADPNDLWQIYALVFHVQEPETETGRDMVRKISSMDLTELGGKLGRRFVGESIARNVLPVAGIFTSAVTSWVVTRRLGDTVRRTMRYRRAIADALEQSTRTLREHLDLLIEGMWFVFTADGRIIAEEAVTLARMLERLSPELRPSVSARFVEDEIEWAERIEALPEDARDSFLHALNVAAAVDKSVGIPERKVLRRAAHHLGRTFDPTRVEELIRDFEREGVIAEDHLRPPDTRSV